MTTTNYEEDESVSIFPLLKKLSLKIENITQSANIAQALSEGLAIFGTPSLPINAVDKMSLSINILRILKRLTYRLSIIFSPYIDDMTDMVHSKFHIWYRFEILHLNGGYHHMKEQSRQER